MKLTFLIINLIIFLLTPLQDSKIVKTQIRWTCNSQWKKNSKEDERQFDEKGKLVKWIQYDSSWSICAEFKYEYESNRLVKEYRSNCFGDRDKGTVTIYKYGTNGRVEEEQVYEGKKIERISKFKFKLGTDKHPYLKEDYYDNEEDPTSVTNLSYDKNGNLIEEEQLVSGSWFGTNTYKFNSSGQLIYQTGSVDGGVGLVEYFYIYDKGILVRDSVRIPDSGIEYHVYETR
jgi:hypothetical protein